MRPRIFTIADRRDLEERLDEVGDPWPEFIHHDELVSRLWPRLYEDYPGLQFALVDEDTDEVIGKGNTIPLSWDGRRETLSGGVHDALAEGFGPGANVLCALVAVVDRGRQGLGLSGLIIEGMRDAAARAGLEALIAPVRPTWKDRHPLVPMEEYGRGRASTGCPSIRGSAFTTGSAPRSSASRRIRSTSAARSRTGRSGPAWPFRRAAITSFPARWFRSRSTANVTKDVTSSRTSGCVTRRRPSA